MTKKNHFSRFEKILDNKFASVASKGLYADTHDYIDTGSYVLNALFSGSIFGGLPSNKVTALAGDQATGKTFFLLGMIKHFLDSDPNSIVFLFESEGAITSDLLQDRGIDLERIMVIGVETIQQFKTESLRVVTELLETPAEQRERAFIALDSLGMLSTSKEMADSEEGKQVKDMTRAGEVRAAFRTLTLRASKAGIPVVITNHTYTNVGSFIASKEMSGGGGLKYAASNIVFLSKRKVKDGKDLIGADIRCTNNKSRVTREGCEVIVRLTHDRGLDRYYGLTELALESGIFKKLSRQIELPDGTKVFEKNIVENPESIFTENVLKQIDEHVQKEFLYGIPSEQELLDEILEDETVTV